ncbi:MAG: hypothetical protein AB8B36_11955 [Prochlorococcus sp.]
MQIVIDQLCSVRIVPVSIRQWWGPIKAARTLSKPWRWFSAMGLMLAEIGPISCVILSLQA